VATLPHPIPELTQVGREIFDRRYQWQDETPSGMLERVAKHIALAEEPDKRPEYKERFYELMSSLRFLPNSPTLFNAGTGQGLLSACFTFYVDDSLVSIMECHRLAGLVMKYGGGVGYGLSRVRPAGEQIKTVQGKACGPVNLLPYYNSIANLITQGGKRSGAQMGILSIDHPDIRDFIHFKDKNPDSLHTFNISVSVTNEFMRRYKTGNKEATELFREIAESAWTTGDPGVWFVDTINATNPTPWLGKLESCNPCGEVQLYHAEACNLGSLNLGKYIIDYGSEPIILWDKLKSDIRLAVRLLDNVIDVNDFPDPIITEAVNKTRKIGLGVMGWADLLALSDIPYDSDAAVMLADEIMEFISKEADRASYELGQERGIAPAYEHPNAPAQLGFAARNTTRTCIAPTGSISQLAGCSSGIEPHYELEYTRIMMDRGQPVELHVKEPVLDILQEYGINLPKTAHEIAPEWHINHQAAFQQHTNLSVSKTINLPETATVNDVETSLVRLWETGCNGGTIYRDKSRDTQVLGENRGKVEDRQNERRRLPDERQSITHKFKVADQEGYLTIGLYEDGSPGEVFIKIAKEGSTVAGTYDVTGILMSLALQYGVPLESIVSKLTNMRFEPAGLTGNPAIPYAMSIPDYISRYLHNKFSNGNELSNVTGLFCSDCQSELIAQEGCLKCSSPVCGYVRCG